MLNNYAELIGHSVRFFGDRLFPSSETILQEPGYELDNETSICEARDWNFFEQSNQVCLLDALRHNQQIAASTTGSPGIANLTSQNGLNQTKDLFDEGVKVGTLENFGFREVSFILLVVLILELAKQAILFMLRDSKTVESWRLKPKDRKRLDECVWRLFYYTFSSAWLFYSCYIKRNGLKFYQTTMMRQDYTFKADIDELLIIIIEPAFYWHASYALIFDDVWRRDSLMMLIHHAAASLSMLSIYSARLHRTFLPFLILRDSLDVLLEILKALVILKYQNGKLNFTIVRYIKLLIPVVTFVYFFNQIYLWPVYGIQHTMHHIEMYQLRAPFLLWVVIGGFAVTLLDLIWFPLLLRLLYNILFTDKPVIDEREYDELDAEPADHNQAQVGAELVEDGYKLGSNKRKPAPVAICRSLD